MSRRFASSLTAAETFTSVSAVTSSAAQTEASSSYSSSLLALLAFCSLGFDSLGSDGACAGLDLGFGDSELGFDVGNAVVVERVVVMSPAENDVDVALRVEAAHEHPDLQVVDLSVGVGSVEFLFDSQDSVHQKGE